MSIAHSQISNPSWASLESKLVYVKETRAFVFPLLKIHWCSAFWGFLFYCACPSYFSNLNRWCWKIYAIKNSVNNLHSLVSSYLGYHNKTHTNIIECELEFDIFKIVYSVNIVNIAHHLVHLLCHFLIFFSVDLCQEQIHWENYLPIIESLCS